VGEAHEEGGGFAGAFLGAALVLASFQVARVEVAVLVPFLEDAREGGGDEAEVVGREEADAAGEGALERINALGDVGAGHPEREGVERDVAARGDVAGGDRRVAELGQDLARGLFGGIEEETLGWTGSGG
jgi:hypothetical protein